MAHVWLYAVGQCALSVCVIGVSVRLCIPRKRSAGGTSGDGGGGGGGGGRRRVRSVAACLRLCLGWVGSLGNAAAIPISILLNLRTPQCLYTCITLVSCPLLVRQFKMFLMLLLTLNAHLQHRLGDRYSALVTRQRVLCLVLFSWLVSVVTAFAQFIGWDAQDSWGGGGGGSLELGMGRPQAGANWSTALPIFPQDRSIIGRYLPYGGFLSKFLVTYAGNYTYAEIHGSHWGVCAADTVLSPSFMVYVYSVTVFILPMLIMLAVYLDLMCCGPRPGPSPLVSPGKGTMSHTRSVALSISLLVLLCLPLHVSHVLLLFAPGKPPPTWAALVVSLLFQSYGLVPPLLFMEKKMEEGSGPPPPALEVASSSYPPGKAMGRPFCTAATTLYPPSPNPKTKVCPEA